MAGDPSDPILASIYAFGGHDFDTKAAMTAMLHGATDPKAHVRLYPERPGLADYMSKGYIPESDEIHGAASVTLEDTNADFAIAQFAKAMGDAKTEQEFLKRSAYWRNIFDPDTKYIRARDTNGKFLPDFTPGKSTGFIEGNSAQYTWMIPYDLKGVIAAIGGPETAKERLDSYFSRYGEFDHLDEPYFFIGNEPSFGDPWIYNWAGYPWRTQEVVRKTLGDLFTDTPGGEPGNDDLGATSSWVVFANLGFYPEIPGVGGVTTNSPVFPKVKLLLGDHPLEIVAAGAPEKKYVKAVFLSTAPRFGTGGLTGASCLRRTRLSSRCRDTRESRGRRGATLVSSDVEVVSHSGASGAGILRRRWPQFYAKARMDGAPLLSGGMAHNSLCRNCDEAHIPAAVSPVNNKRRLSRLFAFNLSQREMVPAERQGQQPSRKSTGSTAGGAMPVYQIPPLPSEDKRWRIVNGTMRRHGYSRNALIETLHTVQSSFGFLDNDSIRFVAQSLRVPLSQAYGVVTFYHYFSMKPPGRHTCTICTGTACYIKGADKLLAQAEKHLHIKVGETTPDGNISLTTVRCVGACGCAPVALMDGELVGQIQSGTDARAVRRVGGP